jgi:hypothetical protein
MFLPGFGVTEEKRTFAKVEGGNMDFFQKRIEVLFSQKVNKS